MIVHPVSALVRDYVRVYSLDETLDRDREDFGGALERFHETGDESHLPLKEPDRRPVFWQFRPLRGASKLAVQTLLYKIQTMGDDAWDVLGPRVAYLAFQLSLVDVHGLVFPDGQVFRLRRVRDASIGEMQVSDDDMRVLFEVGNGLLVTELGFQAVAQMGVPPKS